MCRLVALAVPSLSPHVAVVKHMIPFVRTRSCRKEAGCWMEKSCKSGKRPMRIANFAQARQLAPPSGSAHAIRLG
jgi:hypothetical protein